MVMRTWRLAWRFFLVWTLLTLAAISFAGPLGPLEVALLLVVALLATAVWYRSASSATKGTP